MDYIFSHTMAIAVSYDNYKSFDVEECRNRLD